MKKLRRTLLAMTLSLADGTQADDATVRPAFKLARQDEDWSALREMAVRTDQWDVVKFIPLDGNGSAWLTLGGEARDRFEYFRHPNWGGGPQDDNGYFLHRLMLHADAHVGANFRFFTQFKKRLRERP